MRPAEGSWLSRQAAPSPRSVARALQGVGPCLSHRFTSTPFLTARSPEFLCGRCIFFSFALLLPFPPISFHLTSFLCHCPCVCVSLRRGLTLLCIFCLLPYVFICLCLRPGLNVFSPSAICLPLSPPLFLCPSLTPFCLCPPQSLLVWKLGSCQSWEL